MSGSITRACGGAITDGQTLTRKPREWKANDPHTAGGIAPETARELLPSGPGRRYASVIQLSLWMLLRGSRARYGFCGAFVAGNTRAFAGAP